MIPLFAGILYAGAGLGPAVTFLLMAPAGNVLVITLTSDIVSWRIAAFRVRGLLHWEPLDRRSGG